MTGNGRGRKVKHNYILFLKVLKGKKVNESVSVICLRVMNEKCGSDLILTEVIILEFREYIVPIIHLDIFYVRHLCMLYLFGFEQWTCFYSYLYPSVELCICHAYIAGLQKYLLINGLN